MSGTCASNIGYGKFVPNSNVNARFVNIGNTDYSGGFSSNQIPGFPNYPGLPAAKSNVAAAAGVIPHRGGSKNIKRKIKNITKKYKMNKKTLRKRASILRKKIKKRITKHKRHRQRGGGYIQYQNNMPYTPSYSTAGIYLNANNSSLANPVPYRILPSSGSCQDNYNHYTGKSFSSRGH
jgi:hypothetical protein